MYELWEVISNQTKILRKTIFQYTNYWKKQVFTGKGRMPKLLKTNEAVIEYITNTKGAISFVRAADVSTDTVKIIAIEE